MHSLFIFANGPNYRGLPGCFVFATFKIMSSSAQPVDMPNAQLIWDTLNAYQRTAALKAAIELDLFTAIAEGNKTSAAMAQICKASIRGVRILCDYLTVIGLLSKSVDGYSLNATSATFLDRSSPAAMNSVSRFVNSPKLMAGFDNLTETVRQGTTQLPQEGCIAMEYDGWVTFSEAMTPIMREASIFIAGEVARDAGEGALRVLDIAAGHGLFGIAIAERLPQANIVALDWPNVLVTARRNAEAAGVASRFTELAGDAFAVTLGSGYDVALLTNFLHHFDPPGCVRLLKRIHASLVPGGKLIILEFVPNDDRVTPPIPASFSMMMLGLTPAGDAYTFAEHRDMLLEAGFSNARIVAVPRSPQQLVISESARP